MTAIYDPPRTRLENLVGVVQGSSDNVDPCCARFARLGAGQPGRMAMITRTRVVSALLAALLLAGPLAPLAGAQQPAQPPAPDLIQETLKAQREEQRAKGA